MDKRGRILIFVDWFYPAFKAGGPIKSVYNIVNALAEEFNFFIVTSAYDLNESVPLEDVVCNEWVKKENYDIIYLTRAFQNRKTIKEIYQKITPQLVYFNSLFSTKYTLLPLITLPIDQKKILAPRGMLGAEALKIKGVKKKIFLTLMKRNKRMQQLSWHASTLLEKQEIQRTFGDRAKVFVAQNISALTTLRPIDKVFKRKGKLNLIFFSRINEKKNLLYTLEILKQVGSRDVCLDIFGPIEDKSYWEKCQEVIEKNGLNAKYQGILNPKEITDTLWKYDYLFFPTRHENYGHVIAESLCSCLPIIISKNTPWLNLEDKKIGYDVKLEDTIGFINLINTLLNQTREEYLPYLSNTFEYSKEYIVNERVIVENRKMLVDA